MEPWFFIAMIAAGCFYGGYAVGEYRATRLLSERKRDRDEKARKMSEMHDCLCVKRRGAV